MNIKTLKDCLRNMCDEDMVGISVGYCKDKGKEVIFFRGHGKDGYFVDMDSDKNDVFLQGVSTQDVADELKRQLNILELERSYNFYNPDENPTIQ